MTNVESDNIDFQVIGELKADPGHLLLMGDDGQWYDYEIASGEVTRIEPSDAWTVDVTDKVALRLEVPRDILAW
jgi:hypothetical protein